MPLQIAREGEREKVRLLSLLESAVLVLLTTADRYTYYF